MKLSAVEKFLNDNNVIYLGFMEYGTTEEDFRLTRKFQGEFEYLLNLIVGKIEKDLSVDWVRDTNLGFSYFELRGKEWYVWLHNIKTEESKFLKIKDILNGTEYLDELKWEDIIYMGN